MGDRSEENVGQDFCGETKFCKVQAGNPADRHDTTDRQRDVFDFAAPIVRVRALRLVKRHIGAAKIE